MQLHSLTQTVEKSKKRLGQGHGSGRVKTSGRGTKGQNARSKRPLQFEGGALPLTKRLPFLRGKDRNKSLKLKPLSINLSMISNLPQNTEITIDSLVKHNLIAKGNEKRGVKLLAVGEITNAYVVKIPTSKTARVKIEKVDGKIDA